MIPVTLQWLEGLSKKLYPNVKISICKLINTIPKQINIAGAAFRKKSLHGHLQMICLTRVKQVKQPFECPGMDFG